MERSAQTRGFSLVEVVLALGLATFALIAIIGLLPMAMKSNRDSFEETHAVTVLEALIADRRISAAASNSMTYGLPPLSATTVTDIYLKEDGSLTAAPANARYKVRVTPYHPSGYQQPTYLNFNASWPAAASVPSSFVEMTAAFPR